MSEPKPPYEVKQFNNIYGLFRTASVSISGYPALNKNTPMALGSEKEMKSLCEYMLKRTENYKRRQQANRPEVRGPK